jgi:hypothetical protein
MVCSLRSCEKILYNLVKLPWALPGNGAPLFGFGVLIMKPVLTITETP